MIQTMMMMMMATLIEIITHANIVLTGICEPPNSVWGLENIQFESFFGICLGSLLHFLFLARSHQDNSLSLSLALVGHLFLVDPKVELA